MAEPHVVTALKAKRAELAGEVQEAEKRVNQLDTFCHRASYAKELLNTGEVLASVRDPRRCFAAALT